MREHYPLRRLRETRARRCAKETGSLVCILRGAHFSASRLFDLVAYRAAG
jgi:hypothetical protein